MWQPGCAKGNNHTLAAIGYSLGGNALLRMAGETGTDNPTCSGGGVGSIPARYHRAATGSGFSRLYQAPVACAENELPQQIPASLGCARALDELTTLRDFHSFDDRITAPLHDYAGVHDYYAKPVAGLYPQRIRVPTSSCMPWTTLSCGRKRCRTPANCRLAYRWNSACEAAMSASLPGAGRGERNIGWNKGFPSF